MIDSTSQRLTYHRAFSTWLASCSHEDAQRLDDLQAEHPDQNVRPMMRFIEQCLADPDLRDQLPRSLVKQLQAEHWLPAQPAYAVA